MLKRSIVMICAITFALSLALGFACQADTVEFVTCLGGSSAMTNTIDPFPGPVVRGAVPQIMDIELKYQDGTGTGTVKYAYSAAEMQASSPQWSEPTVFAAGQNKFTGNNSPCEVEYLRDTVGVLHYALCIKSDSMIRNTLGRQQAEDLQLC